jgi:hypothetical protein
VDTRNEENMSLVKSVYSIMVVVQNIFFFMKEGQVKMEQGKSK